MRLLIARHPSDTQRLARRAEPVTVGVPLPAGEFRDPLSWVIRGADGRSSAVQTRTLETWQDGSVRWLLVDARVGLAGNTDVAEFELAPGPAAAPIAPDAAIAVTEAQGQTTIDTGAARFTFASGARGLFARVDAGGHAIIDAAASTLEITDGSGSTQQPAVAVVRVTDRGPLRARVCLDFAPISGPLADLSLFATVDLYAAAPIARLALRVRNVRAAQHPGNFWDLGDPGSILVKDLSVTLTAPDAAGAELGGSLSAEAAWTSFAVPFELYQDSSGGENWKSTIHINRERRVPNQFRGFRVRAGGTETAGLRATPIVRLAHGGRTLAVAVPQFWQNFPRAIEADARSLRVRLFPAQYGDLHEIQGGEQKTHVGFLAFGADTVTDLPLEWCRSPLLVRADTPAGLSAPAVRGLGPNDPVQDALIQSAIEGPDTFEHKREVVDEYGWRHFGEIYGDHEAIRHQGPMPLVSHYNNQYDPVAGFLYQYFRTGDARWWTNADELAGHVIDVDVYHTTRDKWAYNHGLFWHTYHYGDADTCTHRTYPRHSGGKTAGGGPSADHTYTTGLMLHYFLTGSAASKETVVDMAQFIVDADDGSKTILRWISRAPTGYASASGSYAYHGPGRAPANALNTLLDGHRLAGERRFLDKAEEIIRRVSHPAEDIARLELDDPENKWFYLMYLQSLGKYLWRKADLGQIDEMYAYGRATLLHYARWMAEHEYPYLERPERLTFPTETWATHEARKSDVFCFAALHSDGADRERFIERARFFHAYALRNLSDKPTRTLARPIVVLLSSGLLLPWWQSSAESARTMPSGPALAAGPRPVFQTQRQIAKRRIMMLGGAAELIFLAGVAGLIWWLVR